ncbi:MAG: pknH, partial [Acidobacteria bacterium]|nr:pknH [Acidobacteriota bacterium]
TMQAGKPVNTMDTSAPTLSLPQCEGALYAEQQGAYSGSGYQAVNGFVYTDPKDTQGNFHHLVDENVVGFPTAAKAEAFVQSVPDKWKPCAGQAITITSDGDTFGWTLAQIVSDPPKIALSRTQEGAKGWACQHAMSAANNVVIDVVACDYKLNDQASQIVDKVVEKINKA